MEKDIGSPKAEEAADEDVQFVLVAPDGTEITDEEAMQSMLSDLQDNDDVDIQMEEDENEDTSENVDDSPHHSDISEKRGMKSSGNKANEIVIKTEVIDEDLSDVDMDEPLLLDLESSGDNSSCDNIDYSDGELDLTNVDDVDQPVITYVDVADQQLATGNRRNLVALNVKYEKHIDDNKENVHKEISKKRMAQKTPRIALSRPQSKKRKSSGEIYECSFCDKVFQYPSMLKNHMRAHSRRTSKKKPRTQDTYACSICDKVFYYPSQLKDHMPIHNDAKEHQCEICSASFKRRKYLERHWQTRKCRILRGDVTAMEEEPKTPKQRIRKSKPSNGQSFQCEICAKIFPYPSLLKNHMVVHSDSKEYKCNVCFLAFKRKAGLENHQIKQKCRQNRVVTALDDSQGMFYVDGKILLATGASVNDNTEENAQYLRETTETRPKHTYNCPICDKVCRYPSHLENHLMVHTRTKRYKCDVCFLAFKRQRDLERHHLTKKCRRKRGVASEEPGQQYVANVDETQIESNIDVYESTIETSVHAGFPHVQPGTEYYYQCSICEQLYQDPTEFENHMQTHTVTTQKHECDACLIAFGTREDLEAHHLTEACRKQREILLQTHSTQVQATEIKPQIIPTVNETTTDFRADTSEDVELTEIGSFAEETSNSRYICPTCGKSFQISSDLYTHMAAHKKEKQFTCDACLLSFKHRRDLERHHLTLKCRKMREKLEKGNVHILVAEKEQPDNDVEQSNTSQEDTKTMTLDITVLEEQTKGQENDQEDDVPLDLKIKNDPAGQ